MQDYWIADTKSAFGSVRGPEGAQSYPAGLSWGYWHLDSGAYSQEMVHFYSFKSL